jgi:hypothetical protein
MLDDAQASIARGTSAWCCGQSKLCPIGRCYLAEAEGVTWVLSHGSETIRPYHVLSALGANVHVSERAHSRRLRNKSPNRSLIRRIANVLSNDVRQQSSKKLWPS